MKTRILEGAANGTYTNDFNDAISIDWIFTDVIPSDDLFSPLWNEELQEWYEGADQDTIDEVVASRLIAKTSEYRKKIYEATEALMLSAKARALGKAGEGLTESQLSGLVIAYTEKKDVATLIINGGNPTNTSMVSLIDFEVANDFTSDSLDQTISQLNSTYNASIPLDVSDLIKYCYLIFTKFYLGEALRMELSSLCEYLRSKLITNLDKQEFDKIDARLLIPALITNESTVSEIIALKVDFDAI
jgi:hypothetical protein